MTFHDKKSEHPPIKNQPAMSTSRRKPLSTLRAWSGLAPVLGPISSRSRKRFAPGNKFTRRTSQFRVASHESGSSQVPNFFFSLFFFDYTDVKAVTRNINFPLATFFILDQKSHYRCVLPFLHQDTRQLSILIKAPNLHIPEEHVPFT